MQGGALLSVSSQKVCCANIACLPVLSTCATGGMAGSRTLLGITFAVSWSALPPPSHKARFCFAPTHPPSPSPTTLNRAPARWTCHAASGGTRSPRCNAMSLMSQDARWAPPSNQKPQLEKQDGEVAIEFVTHTRLNPISCPCNDKTDRGFAVRRRGGRAGMDRPQLCDNLWHCPRPSLASPCWCGGWKAVWKTGPRGGSWTGTQLGPLPATSDRPKAPQVHLGRR